MSTTAPGRGASQTPFKHGQVILTTVDAGKRTLRQHLNHRRLNLPRLQARTAPSRGLRRLPLPSPPALGVSQAPRRVPHNCEGPRHCVSGTSAGLRVGRHRHSVRTNSHALGHDTMLWDTPGFLVSAGRAFWKGASLEDTAPSEQGTHPTTHTSAGAGLGARVRFRKTRKFWRWTVGTGARHGGT